jgi:hypothetical protein
MEEMAVPSLCVGTLQAYDNSMASEQIGRD